MTPLSNLGPGFDIGPIGFNSFPECVALATDGSGDLYAGGNFTTIDLVTPVTYMVPLTAGGATVRLGGKSW